MAKPKKLVCDRCGKTLDDKDEIEIALEGTASWHNFCHENGVDIRGVFPCENWIRCKGQMIDWKDRKKVSGNGHEELTV